MVVASFLMASTTADATIFSVGGLSYNVLSEEEYTVEVCKLQGSDREGDIIIPDVVDFVFAAKPYSVVQIGEGAFQGQEITSLRCGNNVKTIAKNAFNGCEQLKSLYITKSVTKIDENAADNCPALRYLIFEPGCKAEICARAFANGKITSLVLPETLSLKDYAFENNSSSIEFMGNVKSLASGVFADVMPGYVMFDAKTPPAIGSEDPFYNAAKYMTWVMVPAGSVDAYKANAYWGGYSNILEKPFNLSINGGSDRFFNIGEGEAKRLKLTFDTKVSDFDVSKVKMVSNDVEFLDVEEVASDAESKTYDIKGRKSGVAKFEVSYLQSWYTVRYVCYACVGSFAEVEDITIDTPEASSYDVYNLSGIKVADNCAKEDVDNLPQGLYILVSPQGSKKYLVR